jgi:hypothetical protein
MHNSIHLDDPLASPVSTVKRLTSSSGVSISVENLILQADGGDQ